MVSLGLALFVVSVSLPLLSFLFTGAAVTEALETRSLENELERIEQQGLNATVVSLDAHRAPRTELKKAA